MASAPAASRNDDPPLPYDSKWKYIGRKNASTGLYSLMILTSSRIKGSREIAAFDLDRTLIEAKSGCNLMSGGMVPSEWKLMDNVKDKLTSLHKQGFKVAVFTNQREMGKGNVNPQDFKQKIGAILTEVGFPVQVFISTWEDQYRKPSTQMWDYLIESENDSIVPDMTASFFVGDAAGRPIAWAPGKQADFSCSDRMLAANIGIKFYTPEEFFSGANQAPFSWGSYDPTHILAETQESSLKQSYHNKNKDLILMVGLPASGKTTFCSRYLVPCGYIRVDGNTATPDAITAIKAAIKEGTNVVVDDTNPSKAGRAEYIITARKAGYNVRCFNMTTPLNLAQHMNYYRQLQTLGEVCRVPDCQYDTYQETYQTPDIEEGFDDVLNIPFAPSFDNEGDKTLFLKWTAD